MIVRQVFYQATVRGLVEKAESGYGKVQTDLTVMRRAELPGGGGDDTASVPARTLFLKEDSSHETARRRRQDRPDNSLRADVDYSTRPCTMETSARALGSRGLAHGYATGSD